MISPVGLYNIVVTYYKTVSRALGEISNESTHFSFVACRYTSRKNIVLNAASCQVIQNSMVRVIKHTAVVLHRCRAI